jgi:site-specific DNA-methyltransferase (adenine-specific)
LARKPLIGTVAANVAAHGTGALNVDGCRIEGPLPQPFGSLRKSRGGILNTTGEVREQFVASNAGRWPANVALDEAAAAALDAQSGELTSGLLKAGTKRTQDGGYHGHFPEIATHYDTGGDTGGASRFFYCAKASRAEREAGLSGPESPMLWSAGTQNPGSFQSPNTHRAARNHHPTVKPVALMRWLARLVTPPGGLVLDPFAGSGTTGIACALEGFDFLGIEREAEYVEIARKRIAHARQQRSLWETP